LLEPRSFDAHKNTATPMIGMLGCSEIDIEVLNVGMETAESDDCREISGNNRNINSMLTIT